MANFSAGIQGLHQENSGAEPAKGMKCGDKILSEDFVSLMKESLGERDASLLFSSLEEGEDVVSVRLNPFKSLLSPDGFLNECASKIFGANLDCHVKWCQSGFYLKKRVSFTTDPYFHCGAYYVQDASSMFPEIIKGFISVYKDNTSKNATSDLSANVSANEKLSGIKLLDLCAAPGGKSTHLASMLDDSSLLVSNEAIKKRVLPLMDNVAKWGCSNVLVTNNYPCAFGKLQGYFDVILADVPCSGEGMFRKSMEAIDGWSLKAVSDCAEKQRQIVSDAWPALKEGGIFIYSTCTYNHYEDSDNVNFICNSLGAELLDIRKFVPGAVRGDGQFYAVLRKFGVSSQSVVSVKTGTKRYNDKKSKKEGKQTVGRIISACNYLGDRYLYVQKENGFIKAYPKNLADDILCLEGKLNVAASGIVVATAKGKDLIPYSDLALCNDFENAKYSGGAKTGERLFPVKEVSKEEALQFLTKRPLFLPQMPPGYIFLTYNGLGLGFVKNLGNRTNNLLLSGRAIHNTNLVDL
ncbi:MAG: rRNA cytosine-C5-methyltransferase [Bacteroidales bacterium]|nr:rRNA cytosine-C5-methyltransferase [Bacteroidales bacterium]